MTIKAVLTDIEGTTAPVTFVAEVLFPYAAERLDAFVRANLKDRAVAEALAETAELEGRKLSLDEPIGKLLPDLAAPQVLEGFDDKGEPKLRAARKPSTLTPPPSDPAARTLARSPSATTANSTSTCRSPPFSCSCERCCSRASLTATPAGV